MTSFDARLSAIEKSMRQAGESRPMGVATDEKEPKVAREPSTFYHTHRRQSEPAAWPSTPPARQVRFHEGTPNRQPRSVRASSQGADVDAAERRARAIVGKFHSPLTRDEARKCVDDILKLLDGCYVLTRGKYVERATLVFASPGDCAEYIKKWIAAKPKIAGKPLYLGREQSQQDEPKLPVATP
eukprot:725819-Amphidinium_carterae.1